MPRQYSEAQAGLNLDLQFHIRHGDPAAVFEIMGAEDVDFPDLTPPQIDTTHQRSPGRVGEVKNGPRDPLIYELPLQYWDGWEHEATIRSLVASEEVVEFLITIGASFRGFAARVLHFDPTSIPMKDKAMAVVKIAIMAELDAPAAIS
ncbi:hypothetical protein [Shimia sp. MIT910701]|uniref:hypothetical protein n=1 Tax=Shimia sp. MIT910701 TaxID=3096987 RepID=UPI00399BE9E6